jgi:hypothetical protein
MGATDNHPHEVTYWPSILSDGFPAPGEIGLDPYQIMTRYQDLQEIFIDLEGREQLSRSVVYSPFLLNKLGFIMRGSDLGPQYVDSYPPKVPVDLVRYLEYWNFNDTLIGANQNALILQSGAAAFNTGVIGDALYTDDNPSYSFDSQSDLSIDGGTEFTMAFWFKSDAILLDSCSLLLSIANNLAVRVEAGANNRITWGDSDLLGEVSILDLEEGWADDFVSVILTWGKGEIQDIYINGAKQTLTSSTIYDALLVDNIITITSSTTDCNSWLDELRLYSKILALKDIQTLAAIHPSQYRNAYEIRQTYETTTLNGEKIIYKAWLKSKD